MKVPSDVRKRYYYVIPMPLDASGQGPCTEEEAKIITYEVWDMTLNTHGSHRLLPDAIQLCEDLNRKHYEEEPQSDNN